MKRIGIITIHRANNYGAFLQAFATQEVLKKYGYVEIIDYENKKLESSFSLIRIDLTSPKSILSSIKDILRIIPRFRVIKKFKLDIEQKFNLSKRLNDNNISDYANDHYDVLVSGSDQIWNPTCVSSNGDINSIYFLNFGNDNIKRISYASSMGNFKIKKENTTTITNLLKKYEYLSVREKETCKDIENLIHNNVSHVLDPTLLLDKDDWLGRFPEKSSRIEKMVDKNYVLFYSVPKIKESRLAVEYFSKKIGYEIISIDQDIYPYYKAQNKIRDASISEFLHLFKNAKYIITDSFHGVCFSLIFRKDFYVIHPGNLSNRIESLLESISLSDRLIKNHYDIEKNGIVSINYNDLEDKIRFIIQNSKSYLHNALS
ncbi:hypothetical protein GKR59_05305 [Providencia alcalifaciens]|uniref:polysaccharide pyruvyl transferase family protein n=1 Tax=Providencia TaxID=586 RepID=UPI0012B5DD6B|nr:MULTISPECIES: polysaccharide pyruvyl transferase family protein [Providencia]MTC49066.1 hypothetical protein [Providencia alcalifaciens]